MTRLRPSTRPRSVLPELALIAVLAAGLWLLAPGALAAPDDMVHLVWGSEILHGRQPELTGVARPTPHPLETVIAIPLALLGGLGDDGLRALTLLAFASACVATARIGTVLVNLPTGALAGALLLTRPHMVELTQHGDPGILALAFVAWAGVAALRSPPRDALVLALLAGGGLLRPEVWALSLAYALWVCRRDRAIEPVLGLALAGPLLWAVHDWLAAGDPLWSFTHTHGNTAILERETGLGAAFRLLPHFLGYLLALPTLIAGVAGLAIGLARARAATVALGAAGVVIGGGFLALALAHLSLQPRYLVTLAPVICLLAATAVLGWWSLDHADPWRGRWRIAGIATALVLVAGVPWDVAKHRQVRTALHDQGTQLEDLVSRDPARAALRACRPVHVTSPLTFAYVAYWTGLPLAAFATPPADPAAARALVNPTATTVSDLAPRPPAVVPPPAGMRLAARNRAWEIYTRCRS